MELGARNSMKQRAWSRKAWSTELGFQTANEDHGTKRKLRFNSTAKCQEHSALFFQFMG
jgi:hypothetical protein